MNPLNNIIMRYLKWAPISLVIREVSRINTLKLLTHSLKLETKSKVLDVGCGDGKWWQFLKDSFQDCTVDGIDISDKEVALANKTINASVHDITSPLKSDKKYDLVIGNCSLEHIFDIDAALKNIHSSLEDKGTFIMFVPTPFWAHKGHSMKLLSKVSPRLSMTFSGALNGFFQHWHLYNHKIWSSILKDCGFKVTHTHGLGNSKSEFLFRLFLIPSLISFSFKKLITVYPEKLVMPLIPKMFLKPLSNFLEQSLENELRDVEEYDIFEYVIVCEKCLN
jgi:trans-aconitate methyltransferase